MKIPATNVFLAHSFSLRYVECQTFLVALSHLIYVKISAYL